MVAQLATSLRKDTKVTKTNIFSPEFVLFITLRLKTNKTDVIYFGVLIVIKVKYQ